MDPGQPIHSLYSTQGSGLHADIHLPGIAPILPQDLPAIALHLVLQGTGWGREPQKEPYGLLSGIDLHLLDHVQGDEVPVQVRFLNAGQAP